MPHTNRGVYRMMRAYYAAQAQPVSFYLHLIKGTMPTFDTNTLSQLTQIADGNGYSTDGVQIQRNTTDFEDITEDDAADLAVVTIKDIIWTAEGGPLPSDSVGAEGIVLCDDNATVASREVFVWWTFPGAVVVSDGQPLTVELLRMRGRNL